jgi:ribosome-binding protein aMBF1 (putative translation factor)
MSKSFNKLRDKMSLDSQKRAKAKTAVMTQEMLLSEIRQAKNMSQEKLAEVLNTKQASISKIERRVDMYISTLRNYVEALGGKLEIYADFPEGKLEIKQFHDEEPHGNLLNNRSTNKKDLGGDTNNLTK